MTDATRNPDDYCYRHPDRLSFVLCERCGRTICLECQNHVDGKVLCPDDAQARVTQIAEAREIHARQQKARRVRQPSRLTSWITPSTPIVTYSIMAILVVSFLADIFSRFALTVHLGVYPAGSAQDVIHQPWSLVTSMFLSGGILSLLFIGYSLYVLGRQLEQSFGRQQLIVLYGISGFSASVVSFLLDGAVTSAFGAVCGLIGAIVVIARRMGGNHIVLYISCAITLVLAILFGSWQAVIGGGIAGALTALTYLFDDESAHQRRTRLILIGLVGVLLALAVLRALVFGG